MIRILPSGHWKHKKNYLKKWNGNASERKLEKAEEDHEMAKISDKRCKKICLEEKLSKQNHLNEVEKAKLIQLWKKNEDIFKGKVGHYTNSKVKLCFKEGASKRCQHKPYGVAETHKKLMQDLLEEFFNKKLLLKVDSTEWLIPLFCQGKSGGVI